MLPAMAEPENPFDFSGDRKARRPQDYYDEVKQKFSEERALRLDYRPEGTAQFTSELTGALAKYAKLVGSAAEGAVTG